MQRNEVEKKVRNFFSSFKSYKEDNKINIISSKDEYKVGDKFIAECDIYGEMNKFDFQICLTKRGKVVIRRGD